MHRRYIIMNTPHEIWFQRVVDTIVLSMISILSGMFYMHQPESPLVTRAMLRGEYWIVSTLTSAFLVIFIPTIINFSLALKNTFYWPLVFSTSNSSTPTKNSHMVLPFICRIMSLALWLIICNEQCNELFTSAILNGISFYLFSSCFKAFETWRLIAKQYKRINNSNYRK